MGEDNESRTILETVKSIAEANAKLMFTACLIWKAEEAERQKKKEDNADGSG